jgi:endonuclease YncB( thermonuclease family)
VVVLTLLASGCAGEPAQPPPALQGRATVERVADGDTVQLVDGRRVRLVQIDAPELTGECYGQTALAVLRDLLPAGTRVSLAGEAVLDDRDEHGRLLRYVMSGGRNVNVELVRLGAAAPYFYGGARGRHAGVLERAAQDAVAARRGLWRACPQARLQAKRRLDAGPG